MKAPKVGRVFYIFGSFTSKLAAARKEAAHPGSFIYHAKNGRYYVLKRRHALHNPHRKKLVTIYKRVLSVQAQKLGPHKHCDAECKDKQHKYIHDFKPGAKLLGIPDGAFLMLKDGTTFRLSDGSMLVSDREY